MKPKAFWTIGGDFLIVDEEDEDAPLAELKLHEPLRSQAIDNPVGVVSSILAALKETPHPYAEDGINRRPDAHNTPTVGCERRG